MKCSLGISNFLEEICSLFHYVVFLYFFALITEEGFLISPCYSLELYIQMGISFLLCFSLRFFSQLLRVSYLISWKVWSKHEMLGWELCVSIDLCKHLGASWGRLFREHSCGIVAVKVSEDLLWAWQWQAPTVYQSWPSHQTVDFPVEPNTHPYPSPSHSPALCSADPGLHIFPVLRLLLWQPSSPACPWYCF